MTVKFYLRNIQPFELVNGNRVVSANFLYMLSGLKFIPDLIYKPSRKRNRKRKKHRR